MSLVSAIRRMLDAGLTIDHALIAAEAMEAEIAPAKSVGAIRQQRYRERNKASQSVTRDACDEGDGTPSPKETSPTPPKEITPSQSETNVSSKTPRKALESVLDATRAAAVLDHRKRIGKPMTVRAAELIAAKFAECPDPNAGADAMIANGWQGFDVAWMDRQQARASPPPQPKAPSQSDVFAFIARTSANGSGPEYEDSRGSRPAIPHLSAVRSQR